MADTGTAGQAPDGIVERARTPAGAQVGAAPGGRARSGPDDSGP